MLFRALGIITGHTQTRDRLAQWKQEEYEAWQDWARRCPGTCGPPPLSSSWWDEAIRQDPYCETQHDSCHFGKYKRAYMEASSAVQRAHSSSRSGVPGAGDLMG